jgi:carbon-monoxide dehydrogenase medium subunit/6-hydroxypseudooxynicotine dehydrogenase subunit alpha
VKPAPFAYARAASLEDALALLAEGGEDAKPLAGGQSLLPLLAYRLLRPTHLVDLGGIAGLDRVERRDGGVLVLGPLVTHAALERAGLGLLSEAAALVGHLPIRARGTLGGSLAHADPAAELPVAALALDATVVLASGDRARALPVGEFLLGPFTTALAPGELVTEVRVPAPPAGAAAAFEELALRAGDFALASAAAVVAGGHVRIALGGVAPAPLRAREAERIVAEGGLGEEAVAAAADAAARACDPVDDPRASAAYRRELVGVLVARALRRCRAGEGR